MIVKSSIFSRRFLTQLPILRSNSTANYFMGVVNFITDGKRHSQTKEESQVNEVRASCPALHHLWEQVEETAYSEGAEPKAILR